jgi:hypothetical protein
MSNNGRIGGLVDDTGFEAFDAMPAEIRRAFAQAPYDLAVGDVAGQLQLLERTQGCPADAAQLAFAVDAIREEHEFERGVMAYALYGSAHPDARVVSTDCLLDLQLLSVFTEAKRWREGKGVPPAPTRAFRIPSVADAFVPLHRPRPRRRAGKRSVFADRALFNPRRDGLPVHADAAAALMGDPPIGRRAIDRRQIPEVTSHA